MTVMRRLRWLARLAAVLVVGVVGLVVAAAAPARSGIVFQSHVVASWGFNEDGDLGDGTTVDRYLYSDIKLANDVVQVAAGYYFGLALRSDGTVWAWGDNGSGQLGDGTKTDRSTPGRVLGPDGVVTQVAAGAMSLALRSDGTVWEWGDGWLIPVPVPGLVGITKIAVGSSFNQALRSDGTVWAWGQNDRGQLGNGTTVSTLTPVKVTGLSHVTGIAAGYDAAVATATNGISALTSVWTWGANDRGQLGGGTPTDHIVPERITGIGTSYIAGVTAGLWTGAVLGSDGSVWGWGDNSAGQLARTPSSSPVTRPVSMFAAGSGITQLSAGHGHMLALKSNGTVLAWGSNQSGQLGNGTRDPVTGPVQVTGLTAATQVAAADGRSTSRSTLCRTWRGSSDEVDPPANRPGQRRCCGHRAGRAGSPQVAISYNGSDIFALDPGGTLEQATDAHTTWRRTVVGKTLLTIPRFPRKLLASTLRSLLT